MMTTLIGLQMMIFHSAHALPSPKCPQASRKKREMDILQINLLCIHISMHGGLQE